MLLSNNDLAWDCLNHWKKLGVHIALDDFGSGYSSIVYLARMPIDRLKIDASLIRSMTAGSKDTTIVRNVITLGRELGLTVIAEGVETEEQLGLLDELGCHQAQGYLFAVPACASVACERSRRPWGDREAVPAQKSMWQ
jgi:EAL domain-containing protein (putative c-di-GMP-specific phosphodiesterase class I)